MRHTYLPILLVGLGLVLAPLARPQEVLPPEERDTIKPEKKPPARAPKTEVSEDHTVMTGDTLWDLCGRYLENPWYWPKVWSYNPEITNPHWIFPGQVVRFYPGGEIRPIQDLVDAGRTFDMPEDVPDDEMVAMLSPGELVQVRGKIGFKQPRINAVRIRRTAFVTREELDAMGTIRASREEVELLSEYNTIYIEFKDLSAIQVGQQFIIYRTVKEINHPLTNDFIGHYTKIIGVCQVYNIAETMAVAIIATSTESIYRGDRIGPLNKGELSREVSPQPNEVELRGYIVGASVTQLTSLGESHLVFIDQGTEQGVKDGNLFDVIRREDSLFMPGEGVEEGKWVKEMPAEIWGRIMVVDARPNASTGLVVASLRELRVGDRVMMSIK